MSDSTIYRADRPSVSSKPSPHGFPSGTVSIPKLLLQISPTVVSNALYEIQ